MKRCARCKIELPLKNFCKDKSKSLRRQSNCKNCQKQWRRENKNRLVAYFNEYRKENKNNINERNRQWYTKNKNWYKQYHATTEYKDKRNKRNKNRLLTDMQFKLTCRLRIRLNDAIRHNYKVGSAIRDLGCSILELKKYLEKQFKEGMTWKNHGKWHIDHRLPLKHFDLTDRNQLLRAVNYTNLQPMWAKDNLSKGDKILVKHTFNKKIQ